MIIYILIWLSLASPHIYYICGQSIIPNRLCLTRRKWYRWWPLVGCCHEHSSSFIISYPSVWYTYIYIYEWCPQDLAQTNSTVSISALWGALDVYLAKHFLMHSTRKCCNFVHFFFRNLHLTTASTTRQKSTHFGLIPYSTWPAKTQLK